MPASPPRPGGGTDQLGDPHGVIVNRSIFRAEPIRRVALSLLGVATLCLAPTAAQAAEAAKAPEPPKYLRYVEEPGKDRLETSIVRFKNKDGATVDLIGAVHIADPGYFETLNQRFKEYDALLYEMVKPKNMEGVRRREPGEGGGSWVSGLQMFMKNQLDLDFQLDRIDYAPKNFVHADLDAETFAERQEARGESMVTLMVNSMLREMSKAAKDPAGGAAEVGVMDLIAALQAPDRARQLKIVLAKQFESMDQALDAMGGPDGSVILDERNKQALKVLKAQLDGGKKHVGIFYGAGHMRGMEELLTGLMGFQQDGPPMWLTAWDLSDPKAVKPATRPITVDAAPPMAGSTPTTVPSR